MTDITLKLGTTLRLHVTRTSEDGSPRDLSGLTVTSALRREVGGVVYPLSVDTSEATQGVLVISASADETAKWPAGRYLWDVKYRDAAGRVIADPDSSNVAVILLRGATP